MNNKWQRAGQKVKPGLKIVGKLALLTAKTLKLGLDTLGIETVERM